jgi:hypothetical protein
MQSEFAYQKPVYEERRNDATTPFGSRDLVVGEFDTMMFHVSCIQFMSLIDINFYSNRDAGWRISQAATCCGTPAAALPRAPSQ